MCADSGSKVNILPGQAAMGRNAWLVLALFHTQARQWIDELIVNGKKKKKKKKKRSLHSRQPQQAQQHKPEPGKACHRAAPNFISIVSFLL